MTVSLVLKKKKLIHTKTKSTIETSISAELLDVLKADQHLNRNIIKKCNVLIKKAKVKLSP
jgi:hypothetical protein